MENPFSLRVGQVMTGFGIGCGIGIGVGSPMNLGAIPGVDQVMSATRGATVAFSGVSHHVNSAIGKLGMKGVQAGVGCGVGFGHGFGAGLAIKPGSVHRIQTCIGQGLLSIMKKLKIVPDPSMLGIKPSLGTGMQLASDAAETIWNPTGKTSQMAPRAYQNPFGKSTKTDLQITDNKSEESKTSALLSGSLTPPIDISLQKGGPQFQKEVDRLETENKILQTLLRHEKILAELEEDNVVLRKVLIEELNVSPDKLHKRTVEDQTESNNCFECRRRARRRNR
eukprot:TRINITY_DN19328_c0_g1_i1.p1 TRINITY_DN19328_c0_g1~~TRINITY_DN19328_c0_g1_i1.p1  ORF type:complete len:281 (-),score=65.72 TRINITY_DN19328_c0_g1_i1:150-992(-)